MGGSSIVARAVSEPSGRHRARRNCSTLRRVAAEFGYCIPGVRHVTLILPDDIPAHPYAVAMYGEAGGNFGWDRNLHVVERFSLFDAETPLYQFEIDDGTAFTLPWKGELTMARSRGRIYEYACHEANYSLANMLRGYRAAEPR